MRMLYIWAIVGQGMVRTIKAKVEAIEKFPTPRIKKALQRFLGMAGYYRKFCQPFLSPDQLPKSATLPKWAMLFLIR